MAHLSVRPAFTLMGVCIGAMTVDAGMSLISLASSTGLGIVAMTLIRTIRAMDNQRTALAADIEARINQRLRELELNDSSFGRDYFESRLEQEIGRTRRHGLPLSVIFLKVDVSGTSEGPTIVEAGARLLRTEDTFAPVGRGEYAFFLPQTDQAGTRVVVARLAEALKDFQPLLGSASLSTACSDASTLLEAAREKARRQLIVSTWNEAKAVS